MSAIDLLKPFIEDYYGDAVSEPDVRLDAFRSVVPGILPDDYAETLRWLRSTAALRENRIQSIEAPPPREPGIFEFVGPNPPMNMLFGLQPNHANVFRELQLLFRLPPGLISIAYSVSPSVICLDVSDAGRGRIYHWFHLGDPGPDDARGCPGWGNTFLLAESFTDLCRRLRPRTAGPASRPGPSSQ